jgi:ATP-dependent DNA ligase
VWSLLLGLYDGAGKLEHIGVASSFSKATRLALAQELAPLVMRHPAKLLRWRPDRDPRSCRLEQLDVGAPVAAEVLAG